MEDLSGRVASPIMIHHQSLAGGLCDPRSVAKKRGLSFQPSTQKRDSWNPRAWEWDSARFVAKPVVESDARPELRRRSQEQLKEQNFNNNNNKPICVVEDDETLTLNLGGSVLNSAEEALSRPSKRVRSGSPNTSNYPMCQVDNCKENLTNAKDYHRRHKVCEVHSKASKALVGKQMQRFCQQCSRFHPLSEFDEGKRSCRRRLAGHNKRRRKTQPEETTSRPMLPGSNDAPGNRDLDIVNLLAVIASAQGNNEKRSTNLSSLPDKDQLMQALSKINSLPLPANVVDKLPISGSLNGTNANQLPSSCKARENTASPSTRDLLTALSAASAGAASDAVDVQSQRSSQGSDSERSKSACVGHDTRINFQNRPPLELSSVGGEKSSTSYQSHEDLDSNIQETHHNLPLRLFTSPAEDVSTHTPPVGRKYFSSESSNPSAGRSPSSSPPVVQKLFPVQDSRGSTNPDRIFASREENRNVKETKTNGCITSFQLFGGLITGADSYSIQSSPYQTGYTSSSGSDHSPSSLNSDAQDRTGRIMFKLFDKDPSHLPGSLRTQIYHWLSNIPSEMESHIRPGCIVLSLYLSMPSPLWEQLEENLFQYVKALINDVDPQFWASGRFIVRTDKRLASHNDGNIHVYKSRRAWRSPKLMCVSPLAVVGGQEISLTLRGTNLNFPGTKIYCTDAGGYRISWAKTSTWQDTACEEIILGNFMIHGTAPSVLGRFFIEVENGIRGTSFPIIVADNAVCEELRCLESDISEAENVHGAALGHGNPGFEMSRSKEVVHFLNELGWLFQRKRSSSFESRDFKIIRFKFLLIFSVEHDFCALVKTLLDILLEINLAMKGLENESLQMLLELQLLSRAVKRKCKDMVDLLINFSVSVTGHNLKYIFLPNLPGPGGITPLHLAACTANSDDVVDSLTSDPQEIGLHCWNSLLDENGLSPNAYALMRNKHSYNNLVSQKLANRENGHVSVSIGGEIDQLEMDEDHNKQAFQVDQAPKSCSKCAAAAAMRHSRRVPGSQGLLYRPYIHSMLAIAAVCACVCVFFRGAPDIGSVAPFKWENLDFGPL
nr:squamosa promoter-binding-like protein 14 [Ipomoea batatas]